MKELNKNKSDIILKKNGKPFIFFTTKMEDDKHVIAEMMFEHAVIKNLNAEISSEDLAILRQASPVDIEQLKQTVRSW